MMNDFIISNTNINLTDPSDRAFQLSADWHMIIKGDHSDYVTKNMRIITIGDYIGSKEEILRTQDNEIPKLKGNFYAIVIKEKCIKIYSSFFSMLPIYSTTDNTTISSSISLIEKTSAQHFTIDKKFILENLLFNYGFFNRTRYQEIKLAPCHSYIAITKNELSILKHYSTIDLFTSSVKGGRKKASELSDLFIKNSADYFPDETFDIAFTSGFDGRTLVSCATHYNKKITTFSFGRPENDDVKIPKRNAKELNLPYRSYDLGTADYIKKKYYKNALEYTSSGYTGNGLLYAHFPYSAKEIGEKSNYMLSGACGSELFRALHSTGAVTSIALADVFKTDNHEELKEKLRRSKALDVLNMNEFNDDLEDLIREIITYKEALPKEISLNQQFYVFVFEEIFRKFFGQWIVVQQQYVKVRTPFLDFNFVKMLLQTKYAGANNDFFTKNPIKRMKGQYIYADIIRKTNKTIYKQITGKGYKPRDVRNALFIINTVLPFFKKKLKKKVAKPYLDNLGIVSGVKENKDIFENLIAESSFFKKEKLQVMLNNISSYTPEKERDSLLMSLTILHNLQEKQVQQKTQYA